jgi:FkbM family methyltransferase
MSCISPELRAEIVRERDYELEECVLCRQHVDATTDVIELGGGISFVACCLNPKLGDVRHLVFEANPALVPTIKRHCELNECDFEVINKAYAPTGDRVKLYPQKDIRSSTTRDERSESEIQPMVIDAVSLADITSHNSIDEFTLIVDIEGGEVDLVAQEGALLAERCRMLVVEFHEFVDEPLEHTRERLDRIGFVRTASRGSAEVYVNDTID